MNKILKLVFPITVALSLIACERRVETPQEQDSSIMEARKYIADYDTRMEKVQKYIIDCVSVIPEKEKAKSIDNCTQIAYDTHGFFRSDSNISSGEKQEYQRFLRVAQRPLTTEKE